MDNFYVIPKKMSNTKLKLSDLNPHLMCVLCGGYYVDATTIVECLHSFCRSCIVKHLECSKYCPICEVQVHKTKPLINIRPDKTLQDIVYKLVPGLFANEMRNRRKFYRDRPHYIKPTDLESAGEVSGERKIYVNDENITFSLVYHLGPAPTNIEDSFKEISSPPQGEKRYFKCPTGVTVYHLKKLLRAKYDLSVNNYKMEVYFKDQNLLEDLTLLDISYIYLWKTKGSLDLTYKIFENVVKRQKMVEAEESEKPMEMFEQSAEPGPVSKPIADLQVKSEEAKEKKSKIEEEKPVATLGKTGKVEKVEKAEKVEKVEKVEEGEVVEKVKEEMMKKEEKVEAKLENKDNFQLVQQEQTRAEKEPPKENGLNGSEVKEVQLQISESGVMSVSQVEDGEVVRTVEETTKVSNSEVITGLGVVEKEVRGNGEVDKRPEPIKPSEKKSKSTKPYKTIRCSPKAWHPAIPREKLRPTLMKNSDEPKKPLKFFKMRNMPRFLGNPSSGVKPMYAENTEEKPEEKKPDAAKALNKILKIDPKTLRPIDKEEMKVTPTTPPNLLTNPFIPNNNHFLFSELHLLPPNAGNYRPEPKPDKLPSAAFKPPTPNGGTYPPVCFPSPEHASTFYPFTKPSNFPYPVNDKMDPLLRASRLSPFGNLAGFNAAGFHASLPPSISRLLNPHHHFRKISQTLEKKNKEESTKETSKSCDDKLKVVNKTNESMRRNEEVTVKKPKESDSREEKNTPTKKETEAEKDKNSKKNEETKEGKEGEDGRSWSSNGSASQIESGNGNTNGVSDNDVDKGR